MIPPLRPRSVGRDMALSGSILDNGCYFSFVIKVIIEEHVT